MEVLLPAFLKPLVNLDEAINALLAILLFSDCSLLLCS